MLSFPAARRRAFTLVELIAVIVVLGLLAAVAVVGYRAVVDRASDRAAALELTSLAREAGVLAATDRGRSQWQDADFTVALDDIRSLTATTGASARRGQVNVSYAAGVAGLAMRSDSGACVLVTATLPAQVTSRVEQAASECTGSYARTGAPATGTPSTPTTPAPTTPAPTTPAPAPAAPAAPAMSEVTTTSVKLSWAAVADATSYLVRQSTDGASWSDIATPTAPSTTATGLQPGQTYRWVVLAVNATGPSQPSPATQLTLAPAAPTPPTVALDSAAHAATVSWPAVAGATSYNVWWRLTNLSNGQVTQGQLTTTSATASRHTVFDGYRTEFGVEATNAGGTSGRSYGPSVQTTVAPDTAGAPGTSLLDATAGSFEGGQSSLNGWNVWRASGSYNALVYHRSAGVSPAHGDYLLAANSTGPTSLYRSIPTTVVAGGAYCMSALVTSQNGDVDASGYIRLSTSSGAEPQMVSSFSHLPSAPAWIRVSACFTSAVNDGSLAAEFRLPSDGRTLFIDDIRVWRAS